MPVAAPNQPASKPSDQLQADLAAFSQPCMAAGEIIQRGDGAKLLVHFLGDVPPGEVFKTSRGNTMARAGHGRVALLGGRFELDASHWAEEAAAAGRSVAASLPSSVWMDEIEGTEKGKELLAEARQVEAASAAEDPGLMQTRSYAQALRLYEAAFLLTCNTTNHSLRTTSLRHLAEMRARIGHVEVAFALFSRLLEDSHLQPDERGAARDKQDQIRERATKQATRRRDLVRQHEASRQEAREREKEAAQQAAAAQAAAQAAAAAQSAPVPTTGRRFSKSSGLAPSAAPAAQPTGGGGGAKLQRRHSFGSSSRRKAELAAAAAAPVEPLKPLKPLAPSNVAPAAAAAPAPAKAAGPRRLTRSLSFGSKPAREEPRKEPAAPSAAASGTSKPGFATGRNYDFARDFDTSLPESVLRASRGVADTKKAMIAANDLEAYMSKMGTSKDGPPPPPAPNSSPDALRPPAAPPRKSLVLKKAGDAGAAGGGGGLMLKKTTSDMNGNLGLKKMTSDVSGAGGVSSGNLTFARKPAEMAPASRTLSKSVDGGGGVTVDGMREAAAANASLAASRPAPAPAPASTFAPAPAVPPAAAPAAAKIGGARGMVRRLSFGRDKSKSNTKSSEPEPPPVVDKAPPPNNSPSTIPEPRANGEMTDAELDRYLENLEKTHDQEMAAFNEENSM